MTEDCKDCNKAWNSYEFQRDKARRLQTKITTQEKEITELKSIIAAIEFNGCFSGDCPHEITDECYAELIKIPNMIEEMRKENAR